MDIRKVFRGISGKLMRDFEISTQFKHSGSIGNYRENALKDFLQVGRLPKKYGVGNGEIVGHISNVSRQCDLIIFDQLESIPLLYDDQVQVYPIDSVYGIVEVKSQLSKIKLFEGLENIKSVKELSPNDTVQKKVLFMYQNYKRPKPFGFVFAYSLDGNSLKSLTENLKEWEKNNTPEFWPNLIVVLGEGIIYHTSTGFDKILDSENINEKCRPTYISYGDDSFFYFYSSLLELSSNIELPKIQISTFLDLPRKIGKHVVGHNDRMIKVGKDGKNDRSKVYGLNEKFITKMVEWCKDKGAISHQDLLLKVYGQIPIGMPPGELEVMMYLYNPDNLKGTHEVKKAFSFNKKNEVVADPNAIAPVHYITIDDEVYCYPMKMAKDEDLEEIKGRKYKDL
jgi:hypothetical protein